MPGRDYGYSGMVSQGLGVTSPKLNADLEAAIHAAIGEPFSILSLNPVGGGCINQALRIDGASRSYFVKLNRINRLPMFEAELQGLEVIFSTQTIRTPTPVAVGSTDQRCWLIIEHIDMGYACDSETLGHQLAMMHRQSSDAFGWPIHNTIGTTTQLNNRTESWLRFWSDYRLGYQLDLASRQGLSASALTKGEELKRNLVGFFDGYDPKPALLHGDLWSGNWSGDSDHQPVIFDPAPYYGDHEADLAMMELFGGPGSAFFAAYDAVYPIDPGYELRKTLYNLYHILNHFNLFGGGYDRQAEDMMDRLLRVV